MPQDNIPGREPTQAEIDEALDDLFEECRRYNFVRALDLDEPPEIIRQKPIPTPYSRARDRERALEHRLARREAEGANPTGPGMAILRDLLAKAAKQSKGALAFVDTPTGKRNIAVDRWRRETGREERNRRRRKVRAEPNRPPAKDEDERAERRREIEAASKRRTRAAMTDDERAAQRAKDRERKRRARAAAKGDRQ